MKKILSEDQVSAEASRGSASQEHNMPRAGVYIPNYKAVNQMLYDAGGTGAINFMQVLSNVSNKTVAEQQELYDCMEANELLSSVDQQHNKDTWEFLQENASGKGYTEFATGRYDELSGMAISQASNGNVQRKLQMVSSARKKDIANNAFQKEKEIYAGFAINETEKHLMITANEVTSNPNQVESLWVTYNSQMEGMKNILPGHKYNEYETKKREEFAMSYAYGLIKKNAREARGLLRGEFFLQNIHPDKYRTVLNQLEVQIRKEDAQAKHYEQMLKQAKKAVEYSRFQDLKKGIYAGETFEAEIESSDLPLQKQQQLKDLYDKHQIALKKLHIKDDYISECIDKNIPTSDFVFDSKKIKIDYKDKVKYLDGYIRAENDKRSAESQDEMSCVEVVDFVQQHNVVFDKGYAPAKKDIINNIRYSQDPKKILDGALAVSMANPGMWNFSKEIKSFSAFVQGNFTKDSDLGMLITNRDAFFNPETDEGTKVWKESNYEKEPVKAFMKLCKNNGLDEFKAFTQKVSDVFESHPYSAVKMADFARIKEQCFPIMEKIIKSTGSKELAENACVAFLRNKCGNSKINGVEESMINPPTFEKTGFTEHQLINIKNWVIKNEVVKKARPSLEQIKEEFPKLMKSTHVEPNPECKFPVGKRYVYLESTDDWDGTSYKMYYLENEKDPSTKNYIRDPDNSLKILNFRKFLKFKKK